MDNHHDNNRRMFSGLMAKCKREILARRQEQKRLDLIAVFPAPVKPPNCKSIQEFNSVLLRISEMEGAIVALRAQLRELPKRIAKELVSDAERWEAARYLYFETDIPIALVAKELMGLDIRRFARGIGTYASDVSCKRCEKPIVCSRREELRTLQQSPRTGMHCFQPQRGGYYEILCRPCYRLASEEYEQKFRGGANGH